MSKYEKIGAEYVFTLVDEMGRTVTAKAAIASGGQAQAKIGNDEIALFPERSSNHKRIKAFLEAEAARAQVIVPK